MEQLSTESTKQNLAEISHTLGLFASTIKSGEPWSETCQERHDKAKVAMAALLESHEENNAFCDKCGHYGPVDEYGNHDTPGGEQCRYVRLVRQRAEHLTPESKKIYIDTVVMLTKAFKPDGIDPDVLINKMQKLLRGDLVIEILQTAIETGKITLNKDGYVVPVESPT